MIRTVKSFETNGLINSAELSAARCSQAAGTPRHTIGYELEVLPSAAKEAPEFVRAGVEAYEKIEEWLTGVSEYGVELEGEYELQSPPATHPLPLIIATRGLVRSGWLPESTKGVVTSHISIGTTKEVNDDETRRGLTSLLRAVDLAGGTTPGRLMAPINMAEKNQESLVYSWAQGGLAGVYLDRIGAKNRIEFRTPRYRSLGQFAATLNALYFLSRGFLADPSTDAGRIYGSFEDWFGSYRSAVGLPGEDFDLEEIDNPENLREYIEPYAEYLGKSLSKRNGSNIVKTKVSQAVVDLASAFGLRAVT